VDTEYRSTYRRTEHRVTEQQQLELVSSEQGWHKYFNPDEKLFYTIWKQNRCFKHPPAARESVRPIGPGSSLGKMLTSPKLMCFIAVVHLFFTRPRRAGIRRRLTSREEKQSSTN
jgi:hypothetical protein